MQHKYNREKVQIEQRAAQGHIICLANKLVGILLKWPWIMAMDYGHETSVLDKKIYTLLILSDLFLILKPTMT